MGWIELLVIVAVLAALLLLPVLYLYGRRRWLTGQGGVFDCAMQLKPGSAAGGWSLGWARYRGEEVQWFRAFSLALTPRERFRRARTTFVGSRRPAEGESIELYEDSVILRVQDRASDRERSLAMSRESAMALISWLEAAPPGPLRHRF